MTPTMEKHIVTAANASKVWKWLQEQGGLLVWPSVNLSNLGMSWTTPAKWADGQPAQKPTWQAGNAARLIVDPDDVVVSIDREVKRFHIAIRMGSQGMSIKVTDGSTNRIRKAVEKAGKGAYHVFDHSTQEAVIMAPERTLPLAEYIKEQESKANGAA